MFDGDQLLVGSGQVIGGVSSLVRSSQTGPANAPAPGVIHPFEAHERMGQMLSTSRQTQPRAGESASAGVQGAIWLPLAPLLITPATRPGLFADAIPMPA